MKLFLPGFRRLLERENVRESNDKIGKAEKFTTAISYRFLYEATDTHLQLRRLFYGTSTIRYYWLWCYWESSC